MIKVHPGYDNKPDLLVAHAVISVSLMVLAAVMFLLAFHPHPVCAEDDPCFDCHTMGNQVCGPTND